jgi:hypothetical protein
VPNIPGPAIANAFPFSTPFGSIRYQQIYAASEFPHGGIIDEVRFRDVNRSVHAPYGPVDIDLQVAFAYAATTVATASTTFASNIGDDFTIVLDGVITESLDVSIPDSAFDFVLEVANTFEYNPSQGDLLMQVVVRNTSNFTSFDMIASDVTPHQATTRIIANTTNSEVGFIEGPIGNRMFNGLRTQFAFVPEPSSIFFLLTAFLVPLRCRRRR